MANDLIPKLKFQNKIVFPVNLAILRKYHPIFEVEYLKIQNSDMQSSKNYEFSFFVDSENLVKAEKLYAKMQSIFNTLSISNGSSLSQEDIGNMLYIIHYYIEFQDPKKMKSIGDIDKNLRDIIRKLCEIEKLESEPKDMKLEFSPYNQSKDYSKDYFLIAGKKNVVKMLKALKSILQDDLVNLQNIISESSDIFYNSTERCISLAIAINNNQILGKKYNVFNRHLHRILCIMDSTVKAVNHANEFKRMLFKTLFDYLSNETNKNSSVLSSDGKPKQTANERYRTIYHLCSILGIVEISINKYKQVSLIKDTLKNFREDYRFME